MTKQLSYIRLVTSKFKEMFKFYNNTLGLELKFGEQEGPYCEFETGNTDIALYDVGEMTKATGIEMKLQNQSNVIIIFPVEDVDEEFKRLTLLGIEFMTKPETHDSWDVRTAHCRDPQGNLIELNSRIR